VQEIALTRDGTRGCWRHDFPIEASSPGLAHLPASSAAERALLVALVLLSAGCAGGADSVASESPLPPSDSTAPPGDTLLPPSDTVAPPPDTLVPPPDTVVPPPPPSGPPPEHVGIPFGPAQQPVTGWGPRFSSTVYTADPKHFQRDLETARRAGMRLFVSFSGSAPYIRDENGFSLRLWKQRVDRFRAFDMTPYIDDGTIIGHFILDEADDRNNWNGHLVARQDIEEMARYSKEIWPTLPAIIRAFPDYLKGHRYPHLDAVRVQYHARFGDVDQFLDKNVQLTRELGLVLLAGLNVIHGGGEDSGMPSYQSGKRAMNPSQLRSWGGKFFAVPGICGFIMWEYREEYFSRSDVSAAMQELNREAQTLPKRTCRI